MCLQEWLCVMGAGRLREGVPHRSTSEVSQRIGGPELWAGGRMGVAAAQDFLVTHCSIQQAGKQAWVLVVPMETQRSPGLDWLKSHAHLDQGLPPGVARADWLKGSGGGAGAGRQEQVGNQGPVPFSSADSFPLVRQVLFSPFYRWGN